MKKLIFIISLVSIPYIIKAQEKNAYTMVNEEEVTLIDVRTPEQYQKSSVKNATNIPLSEIENNLDFLKKQKNVVLFCNGGRQSGQAIEILKKHGLTNIHDGKTEGNVSSLQEKTLNNISDNIQYSKEKANVFTIKKTGKTHQLAVALGKETLMKKHSTDVPTTLVVLKGEITFVLPNKKLVLKALDTYEIPVGVEHEVVGRQDENLFILTKEL
ncbi:MAG: rhodanese-like domain-containing protein [Bergeyella zoohelcum]|nr:rhodanese-like domain-containing protein [Bergeyella zoohelcum]